MAIADVNIRRFAYWLAVIDEGSFTKAARTLQIAQPSLSQQVRALEAEVGGPLIERLPGSIRLTPAGKAFLPEARSVVLGAERAVRAARSALKIESGELEVATVRSVAVGLLPPSIRAWHETHPGVTVRLQEFAHRDLLNSAVRSGVGDIAIGPRPQEWNGPLVSLGWEEFLLILPVSDPLAGEKAVAIERLRERRWVLFPPDHGLNELITTLCLRAGFRPREAVRTSQVDAAAQLAAAGIGPTIVPDNMVHAGLEAAVLRLDPPVVRELVAFTRNEWSPSARRYLDIVHGLPWTNPPHGAFAIS